MRTLCVSNVSEWNHHCEQSAKKRRSLQHERESAAHQWPPWTHAIELITNSTIMVNIFWKPYLRLLSALLFFEASVSFTSTTTKKNSRNGAKEIAARYHRLTKGKIDCYLLNKLGDDGQVDDGLQRVMDKRAWVWSISFFGDIFAMVNWTIIWHALLIVLELPFSFFLCCCFLSRLSHTTYSRRRTGYETQHAEQKNLNTMSPRACQMILSPINHCENVTKKWNSIPMPACP